MVVVSAQQSTRQRILGAAERLVLGDGVAKLTLDAIAQEAGVSKGGLLYHFGSKDALITGLVEYLTERYEQRIDEQLDATADVGSWVRAYVAATFLPGTAGPDQTRRASAALLAAMAADPGLLDPLRARYEEWQQRIERDGIEPATATLVRLAADGLWFAELFGLAPPSGTLRERVREQLLTLAGR